MKQILKVLSIIFIVLGTISSFAIASQAKELGIIWFIACEFSVIVFSALLAFSSEVLDKMDVIIDKLSSTKEKDNSHVSPIPCDKATKASSTPHKTKYI